MVVDTEEMRRQGRNTETGKAIGSEKVVRPVLDSGSEVVYKRFEI